MRAPWLLKKAGANSMSFVPAYAQAAAMLVECRFSHQITTRRSGCDLERRSNKMSAPWLLKKPEQTI